jgi:hypothetical protein
MTPKDHITNGLMGPTTQLDLTTWIPPCNEATTTWNCCENGY